MPSISITKTATSFLNTSDGDDWVEGNTSTVATIDQGQPSDILKVSDFGFDIPFESGWLCNGLVIEAEVESGGNIEDNYFTLITDQSGNDVSIGDAPTLLSWPIDGTLIYGSPADDWGDLDAISEAIKNDSIGIHWGVENNSLMGYTSDSALINSVTMTVYYSLFVIHTDSSAKEHKVNAVYYGSTAIDAIYRGSTQIF